MTVDWWRDGTASGRSGATLTVGPREGGSWQSRHTYTDGVGLLTSVLSAPVSVAVVASPVTVFDTPLGKLKMV